MKFTYSLSLLLILAVTYSNLVSAVTLEQPSTELRAQQLTALGKEEGDFEDRFQGEVWMLDMEQRLKGYLSNPKERLTILRFTHREATQVNLPPSLILAVIEVESHFDRFALSEVGARGLMQIMPFWLKEIGHEEDNLFDISTNLRLGCAILRYYIDKENGNLTQALARYNGSLGQSWYPNRVYSVLPHWQP
jgi:soluble lytic murein transglycosylase-like protein